MSLTLTVLRSRVTGAIGLDNTSGSSEQILVDGWLNDAIEQFLIETKCRIRETTMNLTASVGDYVLPIEMLALAEVWIVPVNGSTVPLERVSRGELRRRRLYSPTGFTPQVFTVDGTDLLRIDPVAVSSSDVLHMDYVPSPALMTTGGDTPYTVGGIPSWGHPAIEEYGKWRAADWDDDTSSQAGAVYQKNWEMMLKKARMRVNKVAGPWAPARPGGLTRRNRFVPRTPGTDTGL